MFMEGIEFRILLCHHLRSLLAFPLLTFPVSTWASQVALMVKILSASARDVREADMTAGLGRSPEDGNATQSTILAWRIPWTEEPGGLWSMGSQRVRHD